MCGFCGYFDPGANADAARARIARMTDTLAARGPDAAGVYVADDIALGHRRLSILDLSPSGAQPMLLPSAQLAISSDGIRPRHDRLYQQLQRGWQLAQ